MKYFLALTSLPNPNIAHIFLLSLIKVRFLITLLRTNFDKSANKKALLNSCRKHQTSVQIVYRETAVRKMTELPMEWESIEEPLVETLSESSDSCPHLNGTAPILKDNYHLVLAYYVTCIAKDAFERKGAEVFCRTCGANNKRVHACLECAFFGCFDICKKCEEKKIENLNSHMKDHALKNDHFFAININHGCLFCFKCDDYVYNKTFDDICNDFKTEAKRVNCKQYFPYMPREEEIVLIKNKMKKISDDSYFGLRGIVNIGESCYINCILQIFLHNPVLFDYFFSDKHICFIKPPDTCLMCEMFILFQKFYSGIELPYNPTEFFKILPKIYDQGMHDSFLAFLDILTGLEMSCKQKHKKDNCDCLIHQIFYGVNEIARKCANCGTSSPLPFEPFVDILLDIKGTDDSLAEILKRKKHEPELISGYACLNCKKYETTSKYTTIRKLPVVICFRMNSFKECQRKSKSKTREFKKKSTAFAFNESIDMSEYLVSEDDVKLPDGSYASNSLGEENKYYLFGVVYHKSDKNQGGHYVAYVKQRKNRWFECDDQNIFSISFDKVLNCEPYLLFYYKQL